MRAKRRHVIATKTLQSLLSVTPWPRVSPSNGPPVANMTICTQSHEVAENQVR
jgi:hypothetical protein